MWIALHSFLSGACGPANLCEDEDVFLKLSVRLNVIWFCNQSNEYVAMHFPSFQTANCVKCNVMFCVFSFRINTFFFLRSTRLNNLVLPAKAIHILPNQKRQTITRWMLDLAD